MNLTVRIHDKEYTQEVAQGTTFTEEYNETLDSGTVRLSHIKGQITELRPYDDVYIYDSKYNFDENIAKWRDGGKQKNSPFYRHLLVDQFSEDIVNLSEGIFSYTVELFSETKGLETVQCPNISVTQPLNAAKKIDIYTYLVRFVNLYSPKIKTLDRENPGCWTYKRKYSVSPELKEFFSGYYSQDFTLSNPTLRDVLSTLMITRDMIPYVKDDVIYAKAISERTTTYKIDEQQNSGKISRVVGQMTSSDYCDGVRRQYSDALSQDGICNFVEFLGFRNSGDPIMTLSDMCVETTHKIYRVKKLNLCYYKKANIINSDMSVIDSWMLCKQDITPLVKTDVERNLLSQDWRTLEKFPKTIDEMSRYKLCTVQYSIGGNKISGWGERYQQPSDSSLFASWDITHTILENIIDRIESINRQGDISYEEYKNAVNSEFPNITNFILSPSMLYSENDYDSMFSTEDLSGTQKLKTIFFEIEYEGFYDGALIHSRDKGRDNFYQNDNVSASLTLLEKDGTNQKEKLNRFANKTYVMNGRLEGVNYGVQNLLELGSTGIIGEDDDVIIYRREYSIYDNYILASYAGIQDYVLKNFYTSVYAKYRVNQLMSYGESTNRAENRKIIMLLSKNKKTKNENGTFFDIRENNVDVSVAKFFSAFIPNDIDETINNAQFSTPKIDAPFLVDCFKFCSGNIMVFNASMPDNASGGNTIEKWATEYQKLMYAPSTKDSKYYVGSTQEWYNIVDDSETGAIDELSIEFSHSDYKTAYITQDNTLVGQVYNYTQNLPKSNISAMNDVQRSNVWGINNENMFKDNKERIDFSFQIEPISDDVNNVVISRYLPTLSNLMIPSGTYKCDEDKSIETNYMNDHPVKITFRKSQKWADEYYILISTPKPDLWLDSDIKGNGEQYAVPFSSNEWNFSVSYGDYTKIWRFQPTSVYVDKPNESGRTHRYFKGIGELVVRTSGAFPTEQKLTFDTVDMERKDEGQGPVQEEAFYYMWCPFAKDSGFASANFKFTDFTIVGTTVTDDVKTQKSTIKKNIFVQYGKNTIDSGYSDKTFTEQPQNLSDKKPSDVFIIESGTDEPRLRIDVTDITEINSKQKIEIKNGIKSISCWYFDFNSAYEKSYGDKSYVYTYTPEKSGYHFVFGINVYPEDIITEQGKRYIDIYITKTEHRDDRIFDNIGRQIGVIHNCVPKEGNYVPPTQQAYDIKDGYSDMFADIWGRLHTPNESQEVAQGNITGLGTYLIGENAEIGFKQGYFPFWYWQDDTSTTKHYVDIPKIPVTKKSVGIEVYTRIGAPEITEAYAVGTGSSTGVWNYTFTVSISHKNGIKTKAVYSVFDIDGNAIVSDYEKTLSAETSTDTVTLVSGDIPKLERWYVKVKLISGNWGESDEAIKYITE